jgi:AAA family ATP:ADP antiporter
VLGPFIAATLAPKIGTINLLLFSMVFLGASIFCIRYLTTWHARAIAAHQAAATVRGDVNQPLGGSLWAGFSLVAKSPYLLSIAAFVLLLTWVSTFLYLQQAELVQKALPDRDQQTQLFGWVDFTVQSLSLVIQLFALSRFTKWMRLSTVIMTAPILMVFGYSALALFPVLSVLLVVMVIRRVGEYALVRPCREMLFTSVDRETKYKAKNFIDTAVYRTGDATSGSAHALLSWLGVATSGIAWVGAAVAAVWAVLAYRIGNTHERNVGAVDGKSAPAAAPASQRSG